MGDWVLCLCQGTGTVDEDMLAKVPANATYLTTNLSDAERNELINDTKREDCPVYESSRLWLEDAFLLLMNFFGKQNIQQRRVLTPDLSDFPVAYNRTEQSVHETMKIVAAQMEVPIDSIRLSFYDDQVREVSTGDPFGGKIYLQAAKGNQDAAGLYWGKAEDGKYEIWLNRRNLFEPEGLVATLAHEVAHIKLLGENRISDNNEHLTDLTIVVFGLGIFNANEAFRTFKNFESHGWNARGYLSQMQWGYALALFAYIRGENSPDWIHHLSPNVRSDFLQGKHLSTPIRIWSSAQQIRLNFRVFLPSCINQITFFSHPPFTPLGMLRGTLQNYF